MKKSVEIIGLPVISINEGRELGTVKKIIINPAQGAIAALVIDDGKWYFGAKLLPFAAITAIGECAVTIEDSNAIVKVGESPELEALLTADINVLGTKVLTKSGRLQGKVSEIIIDDTTGKIITCEVEQTNGETANLSAECVLTYGQEVLIISDNDTKVEKPVSPAVQVKPQAEVKQSVVSPQITTNEVESTEKESHEDTAKKFDDKQRRFLLGKKASRRIETDNGLVIVDEDGEITEDVLQKAKLAGKFVELSMNIK